MKRTFLAVAVLCAFVLPVAQAVADASFIFDSDFEETRILAEQGDAEAQSRLGLMYLIGEGVEQNDAEAVKWVRKAAEQENISGQFNLGVMYRWGSGVARDYDEAVKWFRKAAEQGDVEAQYNLGVMYRWGEGVAEDYDAAVTWHRKAAEQGHAEAQSSLGLMYLIGEGVAQDYTEAVKWSRKAAEQGDADAQYSLGWMYGNGEGVEQDYAEAAKWSRKAAEQGDVTAQAALGRVYGAGIGVAQDYAEAAKWSRKAAEQGDAAAQAALGWMYISGKGVAQDYTKAIQWFRKAAEQEYELHPEDLMELAEGGMTEAQEALSGTQDKDGNTFLHRVIFELDSGSGAIIRSLMYWDASINAKNRMSETPLHWAAAQGDLEAVHELIRAGADVNARSINDSTPLHWAAWHDHKDVIALLISAGADETAKDAWGYRPVKGGEPNKDESKWVVLDNIKVSELNIARLMNMNQRCMSGFDEWYILQGDINADSSEAMTRLPLAQCRVYHRGGFHQIIVAQITFTDSPGGWVKDGIRLGRLIRERGAITNVGDRCASACANAFLGGIFRFMEPDAELWFHAPYIESDGKIECGTPESQQHRLDYIVEMLGEKDGNFLFEREMAHCQEQNEWWVLNQDAAKLFGVITK